MTGRIKIKMATVKCTDGGVKGEEDGKAQHVHERPGKEEEVDELSVVVGKKDEDGE
jgi:hypothetical protein